MTEPELQAFRTDLQAQNLELSREIQKRSAGISPVVAGMRAWAEMVTNALTNLTRNDTRAA